MTLRCPAKVNKMKVQDYEARILALIDEMVDTASDDELFASGYLRGHVSLAAADCELEGIDEVASLKARVDTSLSKNASELSPGDQRLVGALWDLLQQQVEKNA